MLKNLALFLLLIVSSLPARAQRTYAPHSVLASGSWYRLGVTKEGIYRIDLNLLHTLGITDTRIPSNAVRLFGNGGAMLPENNALSRPDDLVENAISVQDGGDGFIDGSDYCLFYAPGPDRWNWDSSAHTFHHQKNLYADTAWYFLSIGGTGKRISIQPITPASNGITSTCDTHQFFEQDQANLLNSGKEWYGAALSNDPGASATQGFTLSMPDRVVTEPVVLQTDFAMQSVGTGSTIGLTLNGTPLPDLSFPAVTGGFLDPYATRNGRQDSIQSSQSDVQLSVRLKPGVTGARAWLNWWEIKARANLVFHKNQALFFRDTRLLALGKPVIFQVADSSLAPLVWDITDPLHPRQMLTVNTPGQTRFSDSTATLHEYAAFLPAQAQTPIAAGQVPNQDLHASARADMLIITAPSLVSQAQRLADFHTSHDGLKVVVATTDQVFIEFAGGNADPSAIRDFVKMYWDKAAADTASRPKYLLLFGASSYDYRYRLSNNTNLVPGYESMGSLDPLNTYTSDDFFGMLGDSADINSNDPRTTVDIGIGRIPARNLAEATIMVDKIIRYASPRGFGPWRNQLVYLADDQDQNLHLDDAELISADAANANPLLQPYKIYLDAYPIVNNSAGARYPAVNDAIVSRVYDGTLIFNYSGHGSYQRLADEAVLTQEELNRFQNPDKLPLFITASCDFAPYDDPSKNSLGGAVLIGDSTGAIALLTTTRLVFAYSNRQINDNYLKIALKPDANGNYLSLGQSVRQAKNFTAAASGDFLNNRKFTLLGDPALTLAFPRNRVVLDSLNGHLLTSSDTLRPLQACSFTGRVVGANGMILPGFSGTVSITLYDKPQTLTTLGNASGSIVTGFQQQASILYKGTATVSNGVFRFSFRMPRDISYQTGPGKILLYANSATTDANGVVANLPLGGAGNVLTNDVAGPQIQLFLNDTLFRDGGIANENPVFLAKLYDTSGINSSGTGIGHDLVLILDGDSRNSIILNNYYQADLDSFQKGRIVYQLPTLTEGKHRVTLKAWDLANNSAMDSLSFVVAKQTGLQISRVMNYPNPFATSTIFSFEHNQPNRDLDVQIRIYSITGRLMKELRQIVHTGGNRNCTIKWNGDNQAGAKLAKGIYIYNLRVMLGNQQAMKSGKMIVF